MQIDINVKTYSTKQRILAFFMAFMIFSLTCPEIFEGLGVGLIVHAAIPTLVRGTGIITSSPNLISAHMGQTGSTGDRLTSRDSDGHDSGTYTGRIRAATVSVYDYLTDNEIKYGHMGGNGTTGDAQLFDTNYTWLAKYEPYSIFNTAYSPRFYERDNITIELQNSGAGISDDVRVILWDDTHTPDSSGFKMTPSSSTPYKFRYTFSTTDNRLLGYFPKYLRFMKNGNEFASGWGGSYDSTNHRYNISNWNSSAKGHKVYFYNNTGGSGISIADPAYSVSYDPGLYFGLFDRGPNSNQYYGSTGYSGSDNRPSYKDYHFYWQANIAQREWVVGDKHEGAPSTAIQGLVDDTLTNGLITQNNVALPFFDSSWADAHKYNISGSAYGSSGSAIMNYWESGNTDVSKISFPFYEILTQGTSNSPIYNGNSTTSLTGGEYAKFYQFNSKDSNLLFDKTNRRFEESTIQIQGATGAPGFFPFTDTNSYDSNGGQYSGSKNNYGFGAKFEMTFKLEPDGKVSPVDENGNDSTSSSSRINTRFEFNGDEIVNIT